MRQNILAGMAALLLAGALAAEVPDKALHPYVRASGEATVSAKPDRVRLNIGVSTTAKTAQAAAAQNASQTEAMIAALKRSLPAGAEVHTSGYSVTPDYTTPRNGGDAVVSGYTVTNTVEIASDDLANVGKVIDAGMQAGANNVRGIEFLLKDDAPVRARALQEAARKARSSAEAMAAALGLKVTRVLAVEEGEPQVVRPMMAPMAMARGAANTPVEAGNIQVQAVVTVTVEVAP